MDKEEKLQLAKEILKSENIKTVHLEELDADKFYVSTRGGGSLIIANDGTYLFAASGISPQQHIEEFEKGLRSNKS